MKKLSTVITDYNDGMHSPRNYKLAVDMLRSHPYRNARLYHIVITGSEDEADYAWAIDSLTRKLRAAGMPCTYKGCYERDAKKRFHAHYFILVEAADHVPCIIIRYAKDGWLTGKLAERKLAFNISRPLAPIHGNRNYANVPKKDSPKLADCIIWISYLYKVRSKEGVAGQTYVSSRTKAVKVAGVPVQPVAAFEAVPTGIYCMHVQYSDGGQSCKLESSECEIKESNMIAVRSPILQPIGACW